MQSSEQLRIKEKFFPSLFKKGYVYFVQGEVTKHVKIGFTRNQPEQRVRGCYGTRNAEMVVHGKFSNRRLHGEWFACSPELLSFVQEVNGKAVIQ